MSRLYTVYFNSKIGINAYESRCGEGRGGEGGGGLLVFRVQPKNKTIKREIQKCMYISVFPPIFKIEARYTYTCAFPLLHKQMHYSYIHCSHPYHVHNRFTRLNETAVKFLEAESPSYLQRAKAMPRPAKL